MPEKHKPNKTNTFKGRRRAWQPHEDEKVMELVVKYGSSWAVIASMMEGRTGKQIRDRYLNKLKPNIKKAEWTLEEDQLLISCYYQFGHKWSKIATYLPGRTEGQVKNRFYSHLKKRIIVENDGYIMNRLHIPSENGTPPTDTPSPMTIESMKINCDKDIDAILDQVAGFVEKKPEVNLGSTSTLDFEKMNLEEKINMLSNKENLESNVNKVEYLERLESRRKKLEYLLNKTLQDMGSLNPPNYGRSNGILEERMFKMQYPNGGI